MTEAKTVFVTGASGFIARHIILQLLQAGYRVRGSVRSASKGEDVRQTMERELSEPVSEARLSFVELDLNSDAGWSNALMGADYLMHTASPFPIAQPKNEDDLIRPAVDGTLRALKAAFSAGVHRVILTSSVVAVVFRDPMPDGVLLNEEDWTDPDSKAAHAYAKSKTLAERAAWNFVADHPEIQLTTVNPGLVAGSPLDGDFASSTELVGRILSGKDPAQPDLMTDIVDVRDIASMHVKSLGRSDTIGERLIGVAGPMRMSEMASTLKTAFPKRRIPTRTAPNWFIHIYALFDSSAKGILPHLSKNFACSNEKAKTLLDMDFTPPEEAILAAAHFLIDKGYVR